MLVLAIETSNPSSAQTRAPAVAVGRLEPGVFDPNPTVLGSAVVEKRSRHDDGLMPAIDRACRDAGVQPHELRRVAVSIGPGGFTAIRIAVTTAKTIAQVVGADTVAVPTTQAVALAHAAHEADAAAADADGSRLLVALAWKRDTVWRACFDCADDEPPRGVVEGLVDSDSLADELRRGALGSHENTSADPPTLVADPRFVATLPAAALERVRVASPRFDARAVLALAAVLEPISPAALLPLYPREPEAVSKWRELRS